MNNGYKQVLIFILGIIMLLAVYFFIVKNNLEPFDSSAFTNNLYVKFK